jgi:hypothetical protein
MQRKQILTNTLLTSVTLLCLSLPNLALAGPKVETRGPHGAGVVVSIPMMDKEFPMMSAKLGMSVTPFNLVFLAYQGFFTSDNIPSGQAFLHAYRTKEVDAEKLIKAAIRMNRLPAESLQDEYFQAQVRSQLETLVRGDN